MTFNTASRLASVLLAAGTLVAVPATALVLAPGAAAQAQNLDEARFVAVTESTPLRAGAGASWYTVTTLAPGRTLQVTGIDGPWLRVAYPAGIPAGVPVDDAQLDAVEGVVTLTTRSRMRHLNTAAPDAQQAALSFKSLFVRDLPDVGAEFEYLGDLRNADGETVLWKVPAPTGAEGFVLESATRPATEREIETLLAAPDDETTDGGTEGGRGEGEQREGERREGERAEDEANRAVDGDDREAAEADSDDDAPDDRPTGDAAGDSRGDQGPDSVVMGSDRPRTGDEVDETRPDADADDADADEPGPLETSDIDALTGAERLDAVVQRLRELDAAFQQGLAQPQLQAEIEPLIDEYRQLARLGASTVIGDRIQRHVEARITVLDLRREIQQTARLVEEAQQDAETAVSRFEQIRVDVEGQLAFEYVGRLLPSTVYDGDNLPLRYRLTPDNGTRTIAYVAPSSRFEREQLDALLGDVVGVAGTIENAEADESVPLIRPNQLERVSADAEEGAARTGTGAGDANDGE